MNKMALGLAWVVAGTLMISEALAGEPGRLSALALEYHESQFLARHGLKDNPPPYPPPYCSDPRPEACVDYVCGRVSRFECDQREELREVLQACAGNYGAGCLDAVCGRLHGFDCDERKELVVLAQACRGNLDGACVNYVCGRLSRFECDEARELIDVARYCGGHGSL